VKEDELCYHDLSHDEPHFCVRPILTEFQNFQNSKIDPFCHWKNNCELKNASKNARFQHGMGTEMATDKVS
jgi:hypothetical protein